ncbi:hypothetical protein OGAPHI_006429 [Ogataea philodendri]|uniref:High affinity potassium transporter n=1 Tax=Ogataea philodendri TaxID=1378263 RepID=A0A9P8T1E3_9ASCO|nr:uncharacterized protein OGAPHI_006429 [Ogataea philodendri]KAH3661581.1 hypothetical protein OGAPHI_006429 [Ogataea philodendri]
MSYCSVGAIYGDIGTSPLYTLSTIFSDNPSPTKSEVYGAASCIFWLFTIIVIFKYALIVLSVGPNNNEGGQIAIYSKIARTLKFGPEGVKIPGSKEYARELADSDDLLSLTRTNTNVSSFSKLDNKAPNETVKNILSKFTLGVCFLGCSLVFSDGLLTPTTSVLSAVAGIAVPVPSFSDKVMPVSCAILIVLFISQRFGSGKLSILFSPIVSVWLVCLFVNGVISVHKYHPAIMRALNPYYAVHFLNKHGVDSFSSLMLCLTGCEAMFADVAHFGPLSIQLTLTTFVYPCLIMCYFGQAAYLIKDPQAVSNVFYLSIPGQTGGGYYWFMFVMATLATVIASQALILGVFCILKQLITLDCFPRMKTVCTSDKHPGQIFIPVANWVLMICVVLTTVGFKNSNNVTAAYGLGISIDFILTTTLIAICMIYVYKVNIFVSAAFFLGFGTLDALLIISGMRKVPHGAWFPLMMAVVSFTFISFWRWGRSLKVNYDLTFKKSVDELFVSTTSVKAVKEAVVFNLNSSTDKKPDADLAPDNESITSVPSMGSSEEVPDPGFLEMKHEGNIIKVPRVNHVGIMYCTSSTALTNRNCLPQLFEHITYSFNSVPKIFILIEPRVSTLPIVEEENALGIQKIEGIPGFYRCVIRSGFMRQNLLTKSTLRQLLLSIPAIDELRSIYNVSDVLDEKNQFTIPIVHLFEREYLTSKTFEAEEEEESRFKRIIKSPWRIVRKSLINYIFSPINGISNNSTMDFLLPRKKVEPNQELLYVGNMITI